MDGGVGGPTVEADHAATPVSESSENTGETREEMLSRHRHEISALQNQELSMKKAAAKGSKAEQKAKKKQVEDKISKLSAELKDKHTAELALLGFKTNKEKGDLENLVMAIAGVSVCPPSEGIPSKPSKSAKKRGKRAQQEVERERRIQEEQSGIVSDRMIEDVKLLKKLVPIGLKIHEIKPDGHCLYRAVEHQLALNSQKSVATATYNYQELRDMVAKYMREHAADFLPFFLSDSTAADGEYSMEKFENYCKEIESTAAWGGQLELGALTHVLKKHIMIYSGSFPDVQMGKEYMSAENPTILLSYHRHAYGLGEHYNSVVLFS